MKLKTRKGENQENQKLVLPKDNQQTSSQTNQEKERAVSRTEKVALLLVS